MTLAERLIQRGRNEGISQGISKGRFEGQLQAMRSAVLRALELKHGQVPQRLAKAVASIADEPTLQRMHDRAILSSSLAQFAQNL